MLHVGFLPLLIIMLATLECHRITRFTLQLGEGCVYSTQLEQCSFQLNMAKHDYMKTSGLLQLTTFTATL